MNPKSRLILGLTFLMVILFFLGGYAVYEARELAAISRKLYLHPLTVSNSVRDIKSNINAMHNSMKDVVLSRTAEEINVAISRVNSLERETFKAFGLVGRRFLGDVAYVVAAYIDFKNWKPIRAEVITLTRQGKYAEAAAITRDTGARYIDQMFNGADGISGINYLLEFANNKAEELQRRAAEKEKRTIAQLSVLVLAAIVLSIIVGFLLFNSLKASYALEESEKRYKSVVDNIGIGVALISPRMEVLTLNKQMRQWYPDTDTAKKPLCYKVFHSPPREEVCVNCAAYQTFADGEVHESIVDTSAGGRSVTFRMIASPIIDKNAQIVSAIVMVEDITERIQAERERSRMFTAIEQVQESITITDAQGLIEYVNPSFEQLTGYSREEVLGKHGSLLSSGKHTMQFKKEMVETFSRGDIWKAHMICKKKDGSFFDTETMISPVKDASGKICNYVSIMRDISDRIRIETQLRQAQKMEAIGTLAGGIAHDFNNILGAIIGYTELAQDGIPQSSPTHGYLSEVLTSSKRARDLVKHILTFSRKNEHERKPVQLHTIVQDSLRMLRAAIPATITICQNLEEHSDTVLADPVQIHQVIINLCTNAAQEMQETGGILEIRLAPVVLDAAEVKVHPELRPGSYVQLTIKDTGNGIRPEVIERIFDPFFTTKSVGEGTGMGLAVVDGIVRAHNGTITVESKVGEGTIFRILLPKSTAELETKPEEVEDACGGGECILFVDDEEALVRSGKKMMESLGYTVIAISSSTEALAVFSREPDRFNLVVTDQTMPNLTGYELACRLIDIRPDIPIILCTGFSETVSSAKAESVGIKRLVMKPINKKEMAHITRSVLDDGSAADTRAYGRQSHSKALQQG